MNAVLPCAVLLQPARLEGHRHRGFTLVELLVAMVLSLLVVVAASSALLAARRGFATVDAASQLSDNARFATEFVQKVIAQAGFLDHAYAVATQDDRFNAAGTQPAQPSVTGFNNARRTSSTEPYAVNGNRPAGCTAAMGTACANGSDVLVLKAQAGSTSPAAAPGSPSDGAIVNCRGDGRTTTLTPSSRNDVMVNVFYVSIAPDTREPTLYCGTSRNGAALSVVPLVTGVESFQVLYGTDGVTPNAAPVATADAVADRYLRADQMVVAGDAAASRENWRRVRAVRVGMVLRSLANSAREGQVRTQYPLGQSLALAGDEGTALVPADDGRLRQAVSFTVYLHNFQGQ